MRPPRISFVGGVFHVVTRCNNREFLFIDDYDFLTYLQILLIAKVTYKVHVYAYCITNNHVHLLVGTPYEDNLSKFMKYVNGNFARAYNKRHGRKGHFWGERFCSTVIESDKQLYKTIFYIELNMVRCGKVKNPEDWDYSSYSAHAFGAKNPIVDFHPLYLALSKDPKQRQQIYRDMVANDMLEKGLMQQPIFTSGIILDSEEFVKNLLTECKQENSFYKKRKIYSHDGVFSLYKSPPLLE